MVDVDGYIDESLTRFPGNHVRPMFERLAAPIEDLTEGVPWEFGGDVYAWRAADGWCPQPPSALDEWERNLHGMARPDGPWPTWSVTYTPPVRVYRPAQVPFDFNTSGFTEAIRRAGREIHRLEASLRRLNEAVSKPPTPPEDVRVRALEMRRSRNTGPAREPFHHRQALR
jgi:hypothetical protein